MQLKKKEDAIAELSFSFNVSLPADIFFNRWQLMGGGVRVAIPF